jgi:branched-chain amino acid transport system permease protein
VERFLQDLFDGPSHRSIYALLALGLVTIFRGSGQFNFAQGELAMFSAFTAWWFEGLGIPIWLSVVSATIAAFITAAAIERVIIRPIHARSPFAVVVAAIGLFLGVNALAPFLWKVTVPEAFPSLFPNSTTDFLDIGGAAWRKENIGVLVVTLAVAGAVALIFQRTKLGLAMRAVASNPESAPLVGIKTGQVLMVSWGMAAAIGAIGGCMVASVRGNVDATMMFSVFFSAAAAATLGGFTSLKGAVICGLFLGVLENMVAGYAPDLVGQELKTTVSLLVILVVLLVRPAGLFGTERTVRV